MRQLNRVYRLFCLATFLLLMAVYIGTKVPFSPLFSRFNTKSDTLDKAQELNKVRYRKALTYFNSSNMLSPGDLKEEIATQTLDIVIVIVTVARSGEFVAETRGYLIQTAAAVDAALKMQEGNLNNLAVVCNANDKPEWHKDATFLEKYLHYINRNGSSVLKGDLNYKVTIKNSRLTDWKRQREIEDYIYCLNAVLRLNSRHVLMLEDDALPRQDVFSVIEHLLLHRFKHRPNLLDDFAYIKLYYPQRWQGFAFEKARVLELVCIGLVMGLILTVTFLLLCDSSNSFRTVSLRQYLFWALVAITVAEIIGRVSVLEVRRMSPWLYRFGPSPACCTQAMLYRTNIIPKLMEHLLVNTSMNKDLAIQDFTVKSGIPGYQLEPNLFLHTGMHTSLSVNSDHKNPEEFLFDMPFELSVVA